MYKAVPRALLISLSVFSFPQLHADDLLDIKTGTHCDQTTQGEADQARCAAVIEEAKCQLGTGSAPSPAPPSAHRQCNGFSQPLDWGLVGANNVSARAQQLTTNLVNLNSRLTSCCDNGTGCEAVGGAEPSGPTSGDHDSAVLSAKLSRYKGQNDSHRAGVCAADRELCKIKYAKLGSDLQNTCPQQGCEQEVANEITSLQNMASDCQNFHDDALKGAATTDYAQAAVADTAAQNTQAGPGNPDGNGGGGATPEGNKKPPASSSNSDASKMISTLGQAGAKLAEAMMKQQQPPPGGQNNQPNVEPFSCPSGGGPGAMVGPGCVASTAPPKWPQVPNQDGFTTGDKTKGSFNPGSTSDSMAKQIPQIPPPDPNRPGSSANTIANGGGQMLGQQQNSSASLGSGGGGGGGGSNSVAAGRIADILHGDVTHSPFAQAGGMTASAGSGGGGWSGYGRAGEGELPPLDLAQWLPGGKRDPTRTIAGGNARIVQIQAKEVNIWSRISDHIRARCSQGLLRDCVP